MQNQKNAELELFSKHARAVWQRDVLSRGNGGQPTACDLAVPDALLRLFEIKSEEECLYGKLSSRRYEEIVAAQSAITHANNVIKTHHAAIKITIIVACLAISIIPILSEFLPTFEKIAMISISSVVFGVFMWCQFWDKKFGFDRLLRRHADRQLWKVARKRGVHAKIKTMKVVYSNGEFRLDCP